MPGHHEQGTLTNPRPNKLADQDCPVASSLASEIRSLRLSQCNDPDGTSEAHIVKRASLTHQLTVQGFWATSAEQQAQEHQEASGHQHLCTKANHMLCNFQTPASNVPCSCDLET